MFANTMVLEALTRIGQLDSIEQQGKAPTSKLVNSYVWSQALLNALHQWLTQICINTFNFGSSAKDIDYMLKRWPPSYNRPFAHR